jgi:hypothetical protein
MKRVFNGFIDERDARVFDNEDSELGWCNSVLWRGEQRPLNLPKIWKLNDGRYCSDPAVRVTVTVEFHLKDIEHE